MAKIAASMRLSLTLAERLVLRSLQRRGLHSSVAAGSGARAVGWWIPEHKPRRYPTTPEERRQAAIKYGLRDEDYQPMPPGETCMGEYPDLGEIAHVHKDPYENWSHETFRRNYGEPMVHDFNQRLPDRRNWSGLEHHELPKNALPTLITRTIFLFSAIFLLAFGESQIKWISYPVMARQYPYDFKRSWPFESPKKYPITNYTFEPADEE